MYPESWEKSTVCCGRGQGCSWVPEQPVMLVSAAPAHIFPQLQTQVNPSLNQKILMMMTWCIPSGKLCLTCPQACAGQDTVGPLIEIRRWAHPYSSLMLCCSSHPRPFTMVSCIPRVDTRASHEHDDVILSQIAEEFIKQDLISFSPFCFLMDKVQMKKNSY